MSELRVFVSEGASPRVDVARVDTRNPAQRSLTTEQLMTAMGLVDEILECDAHRHANLDRSRRVQLESAFADRTEQLTAFLDSADRAPQRLDTL